jgi:glutathione S-transferase
MRRAISSPDRSEEPEIQYADTEIANRVGMGFFRPLVMSGFAGKDPDVDTARRFLADEMPAVFDYLERSIEGREYLVGDAFSIADVAVASQFINYFLAGGPLDSGRWPSLAAYVERIHTRPSFAACWEEERRLFPAVDVEL